MAEPRSGGASLAGRVFDYLFGRNTLIGVASLMLLAISAYATWSGMNDFIIGASSKPGSHGRELVGGLSVTNDFLVIAIVIALSFLMWLALRESFGAKRRLAERLVTFPLYVFLVLWSVGFGYGFWWSLIAGEEATRTGLAGLQEDARDAAGAVAARLDAVKIQIDSVASWSDSQMAREETTGGSCGTASGAGRGPLYNARRSVRDAIVLLRDGFSASWLAPVKADLEQLRQSASSLEGATVEERQKRFEDEASAIRGRARDIAARSNALGASTASEMRALADAVSIAPGASGFTCYDPTLAQRLRQAADQAVEPAVLSLREASFNEGPAGVANAVKNLWAHIGSWITGGISALTGGAVGSDTAPATPITGRDLIALLATLGIDLGLFALTVLNPPREPPSLRPSGALIRQITEALQAAMARAPGADLEWVRRHFVHHNKASYFVIPNLYSCAPTGEEAARALAVNQLAGVLSDLDLVRWPKREEMKKLRKEEMLRSDTDLTEIRKQWVTEQKLPPEVAKEFLERETIRNHGLFSKAERALEIAGWSPKARADVEIFKIIDTEGLTPLLMVLTQTSLPAAEAVAPVAASGGAADKPTGTAAS